MHLGKKRCIFKILWKEGEGLERVEGKLEEKPAIFDSKFTSVKQSLVFHKMFTTVREKKYILGLKCLLAPRSLKRASEACGFFEGFFGGHFIIRCILKGISE